MDELILTLTEEMSDVIYELLPAITHGLQIVYELGTIFISMI